MYAETVVLRGSQLRTASRCEGALVSVLIVHVAHSPEEAEAVAEEDGVLVVHAEGRHLSVSGVDQEMSQARIGLLGVARLTLVEVVGRVEVVLSASADNQPRPGRVVGGEGVIAAFHEERVDGGGSQRVGEEETAALRDVDESHKVQRPVHNRVDAGLDEAGGGWEDEAADVGGEVLGPAKDAVDHGWSRRGRQLTCDTDAGTEGDPAVLPQTTACAGNDVER